MKSKTKSSAMRIIVCVGMAIIAGAMSSALAQTPGPPMPVVTGAAAPLYPRAALRVRVSGVVKLRVTTDGKKVASLEAVSGPPMLAKAASDNVLTWRFDHHTPTTFVATFEYVIVEPAECRFTNGVSLLKLPLEARISAPGLKTCDPAERVK